VRDTLYEEFTTLSDAEAASEVVPDIVVFALGALSETVGAEHEHQSRLAGETPTQLCAPGTASTSRGLGFPLFCGRASASTFAAEARRSASAAQ
jgi:hypothetical protein